MTTFVKVEAITYFILKVFGYLLGAIGVFSVLGFAGGLQWDNISFAQFVMYEIHAFMLIGLSALCYRIRKVIKADAVRRVRARG